MTREKISTPTVTGNGYFRAKLNYQFLVNAFPFLSLGINYPKIKSKDAFMFKNIRKNIM